MVEAKVLVIDPVGLHARPATYAVNAASKCKCKVSITSNGRTIDMKSIMGVMSLGVKTQTEVVITCDGENEADAINSIVETLRNQKVIA